MEKALVIGGGGFLGSHVSDVLTQQGYDVSIFDSKISPYISDDQQMIIGDITDRDMIRKAKRSRLCITFCGSSRYQRS